MSGPDWLIKVFEEAERELNSLPSWARPTVTPPLEDGTRTPATSPSDHEQPEGEPSARRDRLSVRETLFTSGSQDGTATASSAV